MSQTQLDDLWGETIDVLRSAHEAIYFGRGDREAIAASIRNILLSYQWITQAQGESCACLPPAHLTDPELVWAIWGVKL